MMNSRPALPEPDAGFALMDALVAVAFLAGTVSLVPAMVVQARQMVMASETRFETRLVADAVLTELALAPPETGFRRGKAAGHAWQATSRQAVPATADAPALYSLRLAIEIDGGRQLVVERLYRRDEP